MHYKHPCMNGLISRLDKHFLLGPKLLYFFLSLQFYVLHQFRGNFALEKFGVGKAELGYGLGFLMLATFVSNIGIATLNDKFQRPRLFLLVLLVLSSVFFQLFYVPPLMQISRGVFWGNLLLYLLVTTAILPLLDKIVLDALSKHYHAGAQTYGKQRLFGSVAFLAGNFMIERLVTTVKGRGADGKPSKAFDFSNLKFYQLATTAIALLLVGTSVRAPSVQPRPRSDLWASWQSLVRNRAYMFFILVILLNGVTRAAMTIYLGVYLTDIVQLTGYDLDALPGLLRVPLQLFNRNPLATTSLFALIFEIFFLFNSAAIINVLGLYYPLFFAQVCQLARFACYWIMNPGAKNSFAFVCIFELLKGANFGLTHICGVQIATLLAPAHLKTTSQMLYSGTFTGLASTLAGIIFGYLFSSETMSTKADVATARRNFRNFFLLNIVINALTLVLFLVRYAFVENKLHWPPWSIRNTIDLKHTEKTSRKIQQEQPKTHAA